MIRTEVKRGVVACLGDLPRKSVALDGYVQGPEIDVLNERFSFDHHDKCTRLVTRATCEQVLDALLLGLDPTGFTAYINDVDGDTVLSVWLLRNPQRATGEPAVRELVAVVGANDAHGPAYPVANVALLRKFLSGVMGPEVVLRRAKQYASCDLEELLEQCIGNIDALLDGTLAGNAQPDTRSFVITHTGKNGWVMAKTTAQAAIFDLLYTDGYTRVVTYKELPDGSTNYTVAKKSEMVSGFPVGPTQDQGSILSALNAREVGWGGGSTIGGSPRNADGSRSHLTPDEVFEIVAKVLAS